jgi:methyl-accepting chemotaxis protein
LKKGPFRQSGLARIWRSICEHGSFEIQDFSFYKPLGRPVFFVGVPIFNEEGKPEAVLVLALDGNCLNQIVGLRDGMGKSGESYLIGGDFLMRSNSFFQKHGLLQQKVETDSVRRALAGKDGVETISNYRGIEVLSAYAPLELKKRLKTNFDWAIVSEIDAGEAFAQVEDLVGNIYILGALLLLLALVAVCLAGRAMTLPMKLLMAKVRLMADGDLTVKIPPTQRTDEVGQLVNAFNQMVEMLRRQTSEVIAGAQTISTTVTEISSTTAELAASATESSSSVSEIVATVEEVRQTSHLSHEKATQVAELAEQVMHRAENGRRMTATMISGMEEIRTDMGAIAESIIYLSEQSQNIGEIIEMVGGLADQSNMLSVNASIEAAKAGEHGKGFAVVAQEIKILADQSKEATREVRRLLNDIQKATSSAVMATERGSKAVDKGVEQSEETGIEIDTMADISRESSDASSQIEASSQQQLIGMDQVAQAMESIRNASLQNVEGARQLESAINNLGELSEKLQEVSTGLKV